MSYTPDKYDNVEWDDLPYEEQVRRIQWSEDSAKMCEECKDRPATTEVNGIPCCENCKADAQLEDLSWEDYDSHMY